jgi:hypothetical protein
MEPGSKERLVVLTELTIALLEKNDEPRWAKLLKDLLEDYINLTHSKTKKEAVILIKETMLGGMGSLSDLILYKDDKPSSEETDKLKALLDGLFAECELIEYERLPLRIAENFTNLKYRTYRIDMDDVLCQYEKEDGKLGKFFHDEKLPEQPCEITMPPIRPARKLENAKICKVKNPNGTLMRIGKVHAINETGHLDVYIEKPWRIPELRMIKE